MQAYWKRYDRVERETRRRLEKEAEEQRKMDVEFMEVSFLVHYSCQFYDKQLYMYLNEYLFLMS